MKSRRKNQSFGFTLTEDPVRAKKSGYFPGFICSFLLFFFALSSFVLHFFLIFSPDFHLLSMAGFSLVLSFACTMIFTVWKKSTSSRLLPVAGVLFLLALCLSWRKLFMEGYSAVQILKSLLNRAYNLQLFADNTQQASVSWSLCFFLGVFYLLLLLLTMVWKRRLPFVLLLGLPLIFSFVLEISIPVMAFALPLGAFVLWRGALYPRNLSRLWGLTLPLQAAIFLIAAYFLAPLISPWVFSSSEALSSWINTAGNRLMAGSPFSAESAEDSQRQNSQEDGDTSQGSEGFSYESPGDSQQITSNPPVFTSQSVFTVELDQAPAHTLYLRGFIGGDYADYQWSSPENQEWYTYARSRGFSMEEAQEVYALSDYALDQESFLSLSLAFSSGPSFTYLPLTSLGENLHLSESNRLDGPSRNTQARYFPLNLQTFSQISLEELPSESQSLAETYENFCRSRYMDWEPEDAAPLLEELNQLPVYSSMPPEPSEEDIQNAAAEIQDFLWSHASYSLSLEPFTQGNPLSQELLYNQKAGFCIHFATVGTQLFRMYGIPARYVSGYSLPESMFSQSPSGDFTSDVPDSRAHAWVEIYTRNAGWIPVEVTPGASTPEASISSEETAQPENSPAQEPVSQTTQEEKGSSEGTGHISGLLLAVVKTLFLILLFLGLVFLGLLFLRRLAFRRELGYFAGNPTQAYLTVFKNLLELWERQFSIDIKTGLDREYFRLFSEKLPEALGETLVLFYQEAEGFAYDRKRPSPAQLRRLRRFYLARRKEYLAPLKGPARFFYAFRHFL